MANKKIILMTLGVATLALSACSAASSDSSASSSASASASSSVQALPPVTITPDFVANGLVQVDMGNTVVVSVDDVTGWTASIADTAVAEWVAGKEEDGTTYNPGITPIKVGSTDVVLTSPDGKEYKFKLEVTD